MNTRLNFIHQIAGWVKLELEQLQAAIQAGWDVEHHRDGTHTGATGTFTTNDGKTVTVTNGIITSIV